MLRRLSKLNHERYAEEVAQGLHGKASGKRRSRKPDTPTSSESTKATSAQQAGFDFGAGPSHPSYADGDLAQAILDYYRTHPGWHAKSDVLGATGLTSDQWNTTIGDLVAQGHIERKGEKRGTRYRMRAEIQDYQRETS